MMIFLNKNYYGLVASEFLNQKYISYVFGASIHTKTGYTPYDATAIDDYKQKAIIKSYSEYLERRKLALPMYSHCDKLCFDFISRKIVKTNAHFFGYMNEKDYNYSDTTGTSSGLNGRDLIIKAVLELLEKNQMLVFWYAQKGKYILKDKLVNNKISKMCFSSETVEIFYNKEISNCFTFFVILISKGRIIASGSSADLNSELALDKALYEARLLEWQNKNNLSSSLFSINDETHKTAITYINILKDKMQKEKFVKKFSKNIIIKPWISSILIDVINGHNDWDQVTIKCISFDLINCLPLKKNLEQNTKVTTILSKFSIDNNILKYVPDCILL